MPYIIRISPSFFAPAFREIGLTKHFSPNNIFGRLHIFPVRLCSDVRPSSLIVYLFLQCTACLRIHIKMGMQRVPPEGKKTPMAYSSGITPAFTQFRRGKDADWAGEKTSTNKDVLGIEEHAGNWKGFASEHKVHAVFAHLHTRGTLVILDW